MPVCPLLLVPWSLDYNCSPLVPPCLVPSGFLTQLLLSDSVKKQIFLEREKYEPGVGWMLNTVCQPQCHRTVSPLLWDSSDTAALSLVCGKSVRLSSAQKRKIRKEIKVSYCIYCCAGFFSLCEKLENTWPSNDLRMHFESACLKQSWDALSFMWGLGHY